MGVTQEQIHQRSMEISQTSKAVIPYLEDEIERLEGEVAAYRAGERADAQFVPFRLRQGVYGQRQPDVQMIRVKIPGGFLTPEALEALSVVAQEYAPLQKGHITTREDMQFHHIPLPQAAQVLRVLGAAGLSTREACGNSVRNVVGPATAGVCADELFDPTPYLSAYVRFGVRHPITQSLPRKFKTAFTGCPGHDTVAAAIQDLTYVAQLRQEDGVPRRGFRVYVGGGTSIMPRLANVLFDSVPEEEFLRVALAIWTVFNNCDMLRKNRMMARLKVLIHRIGLDAFRQQVEAELEKIGPIDPRPLMAGDAILRETPPPLGLVSPNGYNGGGQYGYWKETNVVAQRQEGYHLVYMNPARGDLTHTQLRALADIVRRYTGGLACTTQEQNLVLRYVPGSWLYDVWHSLDAIGLAEPGANTIANVVSCPGTDSCKLGITSSMGLARAIREELGSWDGLLQDEGVQKMRIKMSGCPNGCGWHHIANIGFHGAAMKGPDGRQIPAYELFLGGAYGGDRVEDSRIGTRIPQIKVPAKLVPGVVREIIAYYKENRQGEESFNQFLDRAGLEQLTAVAARAHQSAESAESGSDLYYDWERTNLYKLERGEGECAV